MRYGMAIVAALFVGIGVTQAAHVWEDSGTWWDSHFTSDPNAPRYTAQEVSLDLFGSYINPEGNFNDLFETDIHHGFWGGGAGLNYFFTRELGIGTDFNISSKPDDINLVDYWVGNIYARLPLGNSGLAPYIYGGGGRAISPIWQWTYGGGVGLEYRFNPATGIFSDARFLWGDKGTVYNNLVIRVGLRLTF
ncbi:MAG TPA: hypothetical protein VL361_28945 [Candidatus Limnocylindrales bacterium]|nr:hypothetical protein [Candidatus Limnocylindrales bacterium]